jgi:hypothetical protein
MHAVSAIEWQVQLALMEAPHWPQQQTAVMTLRLDEERAAAEVAQGCCSSRPSRRAGGGVCVRSDSETISLSHT